MLYNDLIKHPSLHERSLILSLADMESVDEQHSKKGTWSPNSLYKAPACAPKKLDSCPALLLIYWLGVRQF